MGRRQARRGRGHGFKCDRLIAAGRVRRRCAGEGLEAALVRRGQGNRKPRSLDGGSGARLVALARPQPPEGRSRWTTRPLADRPGGPGTVGKTWKKRHEAVA